MTEAGLPHLGVPSEQAGLHRGWQSPKIGPMARIVPTGLKWIIRSLSVSLFVLLAWLLQFALGDIGDLTPPARSAYLERHLDPQLLQRERDLERDLEESEAEVGRHVEVQDTLLASMDVARETMQEMTGLHRLSIEQGIPPSPEQEAALADAQGRFIAAQEAFEQANARISELNAAAAYLLGVAEDGAVGSNVVDLLPDRDVGSKLRRMLDAIGAGQGNVFSDTAALSGQQRRITVAGAAGASGGAPQYSVVVIT